jgi:formylmethanofuran dehydrogenase subunit E
MAVLEGCLIGHEKLGSRGQVKKLIVFAEMGPCAGYAVAGVPGVTPGRRSLTVNDYGIMAATFLNFETRKACRMISKEEARELDAVGLQVHS